jgi:aspartate racemase
MPQHIGIVACSAEGASLCHRTICAEAERWLGAHAHPELSLHSHSLADYVACLERADRAGVAALMLDSAHKLARSGADFLICPDNTIHQAMAQVEPRSPLPWLHIADAVGAEAEARGHRRLGLLGTRWLVESSVYPERLEARGLAWARPGDADRELVHRIIMEQLVRGIFEPAAAASLQGVLEHLKQAGCDAAVLGCTELPLIVDASTAALPTLDSTRLLARAALRRAIG